MKGPKIAQCPTMLVTNVGAQADLRCLNFAVFVPLSPSKKGIHSFLGQNKNLLFAIFDDFINFSCFHRLYIKVCLRRNLKVGIF